MIIPNAIRVFNSMSSIVSHHGLKTFSASVLSSRVLRTSPSKAIEAIIRKHNFSLNKTFNNLSVTIHIQKKYPFSSDSSRRWLNTTILPYHTSIKSTLFIEEPWLTRIARPTVVENIRALIISNERENDRPLMVKI